jgi:hypothetical protein
MPDGGKRDMTLHQAGTEIYRQDARKQHGQQFILQFHNPKARTGPGPIMGSRRQADPSSQL